ncbi:ATP-binding cassette domain-containing protein [Acidimicrobiia bacterium EGI L10123]|uniref:ABC transporter ATP-binding protein n=1 Tax=Salinilacustrithrix flava TaxID=2957203 RepID=UPI003D7C18C3|nr:ATP-binding cassette domain-containing protein [Acidimicrobiia bacterium EGI L10123]
MLRVRGLTKRYGPLLALDDVGFDVPRGEIVGFLGPNGSGKTTTMRAIMRLVSLDAGDVSWDGVPVDAGTRQHFGYMPAERGMYPRMKLRNHLAYYGELSGLSPESAGAAADRWLERLGLADRAEDTIQSLSSGNQQRVQLALALLNEPDLLVLDEPFSGLDPVAVEMLSDILREQVDRGAALLLSSHQLDLVADVCSAVVIVDRGRIVLRGDVAALRAASPTRYVEVEFADAVAWNPGRPSDVSAGGRRHRIAVEAGSDADRLIEEARSLGPVVGYSFLPPDLSEVFLGVVGRATLDDPEHERAEVAR